MFNEVRMKRKTLFMISLVYGVGLLILSMLQFAMALAEPSFLLMAMVAAPIGLMMIIGSIGIRSGKNYGKVLLVISGILSFPLGLIVAIPAIWMELE